MPRLIIHEHGQSREQIRERRLLENLKLSPQQRLSKMYTLNALCMKLKKGPLKTPQGLGVVLKKNSK